MINRLPVIPVVVLAAGSSTRLGKPKQLISWKGVPLVRHIAQIAMQANTGPVVVVLGAGAENIRPCLNHPEIKVLINPDWASGPGSSLASGIAYLNRHEPHAEAVIVTTCDQPLLTPEHLRQLAVLYRQHITDIVASAYNQTAGVPALFSKSLFTSLIQLPPHEGARSLIRNSTSVVTLPFPEGRYDLDTPEDLDYLQKISGL